MNLQSGEFALLLYSIVFGLCVVSGGILIAVLFRKDPARTVEALKTFYDNGNGLRIITVLTVLATAGVLGFGGKLDQGVVSLLSGVAGFVLGGLKPPRTQSDRRHETDGRSEHGA